MITLNFSTAENLIFTDREAQQVLPTHMFSLFEQWRLAKRLPMLKALGKQAVLDLLNTLSEDDVSALEVHFGDKIWLEKLNYQLAASVKIPLDQGVCGELCKLEGFQYFCTWRDQDYLYLSLWR